jgi:hypothetical protein
MALTPKLADTAVNAEANAVVDLLDGGKIQIYDGAQPANADTAVSTQTLLAELTFGTPAFGAAAAGVATANAITPDSSADATGTATWFRALKSDTTKMFDGSVGTSGCNLNLNSTAIQLGAAVSISAFTFTASKG